MPTIRSHHRRLAVRRIGDRDRRRSGGRQRRGQPTDPLAAQGGRPLLPGDRRADPPAPSARLGPGPQPPRRPRRQAAPGAPRRRTGRLRLRRDHPTSRSSGAPDKPPTEADAVVWAIGRVRPNTDWLPESICSTSTASSRSAPPCRPVRGPEIFAIGDVAATDPLRSSCPQPRRWPAGRQHPRPPGRPAAQALPGLPLAVGVGARRPGRRAAVLRRRRSDDPDSGVGRSTGSCCRGSCDAGSTAGFDQHDAVTTSDRPRVTCASACPVRSCRESASSCPSHHS